MRLKIFKPTLLLFTIAFFLSLHVFGQQPVLSKAVNFKVSAAVRDLPPIPAPSVVKKDKDDINEKNTKIIRNIDPNAKTKPDGALSPKSSDKNGTAKILPPPFLSFDGISSQDNFNLFGFRVSPPDPTSDVGPNHYVQMVNLAFRVWDKAGNPLTPAAKVSSLFAPLGAPCGSIDDGDPIVLYDQLADRWLISQFCLEFTPNPHQLIAISQTGDPTGAYYLYDFMMPNNKINDYPKFGMWPDGYYMTDNQFNQAGTAFLGAGVFAFDRTKMLAGDPTASFIYFDLFPVEPTIGGMLPTDLDGYTPPPIGSPCPFAYFTADEFGDPGDAIRIFDFHADFAVPANSTFLERIGSPLAVAAFDPRNPGGRDDITQPPPALSTAFLDAIGDRLMFRLAYRNFGSGESLILNHTVNTSGVAPTTPANYTAGVRFYQLSRATPAAAFTIVEQETFSPDATHRWMGSGAINHQGDIAVGYSVSSLTTFPGIRYAAKLGTDLPGSGLIQGEIEIINGSGVQRSDGSRWGDYSQMAIDPNDDCTFWYTQEYYTAAGQASSTVGWQTRIASFSPGTCTISPRGTISGTITDCATGLPIQNALVQITGGYARSTGAAGTYGATVVPGTYNATVTAPLYSVASAINLVVTNAGTATFSACLNGVPQLVADGFIVTADDCNSNGKIDTDENITISLGIKNTGAANTTNLVATLLPTGGVTNPGVPQNYGAVIAGGATITRSFTFTAASVACGSQFIITLQLQDGITDYGTLSYSPPTGGFPDPTSTTYSSGNISVPIPDASTVDIPITITDVNAISDINVSFRLNHTFDGDLEISLIHPDGTSVLLVNNRGGGSDNFGTGENDCSGTPTVFDDQATSNISAGAAPFAGTFKPESPLSVLNGKPFNGTWKLKVSDQAGLDVGTVGCFQLELRGVQCCTPLLISGSTTVVAENCSAPNNAIDPNETVTVSFCVLNTGDKNTTNLVGTLLATGGIIGPSGPQNFGVVEQGGPAVCRDFSFTAIGTCGSTITATIQLQDGTTDLGTVTYTLVLGAVSSITTTFSNVTPIIIPAGAPATTSGAASPYPSDITVSGLAGTIFNVTVKLKQFNHTFPDDVDILLVGPGGQKLVLMSDAGGSLDAINVDITLDDAAAALLPDNTLISTGTYRPTNYGTGDTYPAPAPAGPYAALLSVFNGIDPNGTWSLFVTDDAGGDLGNFNGGWELTITSAVTTCCENPCVLTCPANLVVVTDPGQTGAVVNYAPSTTGTCGVITSSHPSGSFFPIGTTTVTLTSSSGPTCTFTVTVLDFICSYTQGYYGNKYGTSCDGTNSYNNPVALMRAELLNGGTITVGRPGNSVILPASNVTEATATAGRLNSVMPGNGAPNTLTGNCIITNTCFNSYLTKLGRINNVLLSQTIALSLNLRMPSSPLGSLLLQKGWLATQKRSGCGPNAILVSCSDPGAIQSFRMNESVVNYLTNFGGNAARVSDLLNLANDVLGKVLIPGTPGANGNTVPSLVDINNQIDVINTAFNNCRKVLGYFSCQKTCANIGDPCPLARDTELITSKTTDIKSDEGLKVNAFPNPFTDRFSLIISSPVSGTAYIEFYNLNGAKVFEMKQSIIAETEQVVNYTGPTNIQSLLYKVRVNDYQASGTVLKPSGNLNEE